MTENKSDKGFLGGSCNRTACQAPGAIWYNHSTQEHYCYNCAMDLNRYHHKDTMELYDHEMCTKVDLTK